MAITVGAALVEDAGQVTAISDPSVITHEGFSAGTITQLTPVDKVNNKTNNDVNIQ